MELFSGTMAAFSAAAGISLQRYAMWRKQALELYRKGQFRIIEGVWKNE